MMEPPQLMIEDNDIILQREEEDGGTDVDEGADDDDASIATSASVEEEQMIQVSDGDIENDRMALTSEERLYALKIKAAVEEDPELDNLSDFMYAQLSIVSLHEHGGQENLEAVLEQVAGLQGIRQEYFVRDTLEHGCEMLRRVTFDLLPGLLMSFGYSKEKDSYIRAVNMGKFDMSIFMDPVKVRIWLSSIYYMNHCHVPDFKAVRTGFVLLAECKGYDWRNQNMFHMKAFMECAPSFAIYPIKCKQTIHYHTGTFIKLLVSLSKRLLPKHLTDTFEFHSDCEYGDLEVIFSQPTPDIANQRLLDGMKATLQLRYQNESNFTL